MNIDSITIGDVTAIINNNNNDNPLNLLKRLKIKSIYWHCSCLDKNTCFSLDESNSFVSLNIHESNRL